MPARVVVLVSGSGTLLQALLDQCANPQHPVAIVGVVADRSNIAALERAEVAGVSTLVVEPGDFVDRAAWGGALRDRVASFAPDWIVSAGFMRILPSTFLTAFPQRVINTHPALLPAFPGAHGVRDALAYGARVTGCTVHLVDEGVDTGPIIAQRAVTVEDGDSEELLHERIKVVERALVVEVMSALAMHGCTVNGRKVSIP